MASEAKMTAEQKYIRDLEQQNQSMAQVLTYLLANRSKKEVDVHADAIRQLLDNTLEPPSKRRKT